MKKENRNKFNVKEKMYDDGFGKPIKKDKTHKYMKSYLNNFSFMDRMDDFDDDYFEDYDSDLTGEHAKN